MKQTIPTRSAHRWTMLAAVLATASTVSAWNGPVDVGVLPAYPGGANFHVLTNGHDVTYTGVGAGADQVPGVDGIGYWISGEDLKGPTQVDRDRDGLRDDGFGYKQVAHRMTMCILGSAVPQPRIHLPAVIFSELDGRNAHDPDVFLTPGCTSTGQLMGAMGGTLPYGTPPGSLDSFLVTDLPAAEGPFDHDVPFLIPNHGLEPAGLGGQAEALAVFSASIPVGSTGFCYTVQFDWVPTCLPSGPSPDGWWVWATNSADGNQYWAMSNDELNVFQSQSVATTQGLSELTSFWANVDFAVQSLSADPVTNVALLPAGHNGTGAYYSLGSPAAGLSPNGGFDLGRHGAISFSGLLGSFNSQTLLTAQDPRGAAIPGIVPSFGFVTFNNEDYDGDGLPGPGGWRFVWIAWDWSLSFGTDPELDPEILRQGGAIRAPFACLPTGCSLWVLSVLAHATSHQPSWPDPDGGAAGSFGVDLVAGASPHVQLASFSGLCAGVPIGWSYGTSGMLGPGGPLTWDPAVNAPSIGRQILLLE